MLADDSCIYPSRHFYPHGKYCSFLKLVFKRRRLFAWNGIATRGEILIIGIGIAESARQQTISFRGYQECPIHPLKTRYYPRHDSTAGNRETVITISLPPLLAPNRERRLHQLIALILAINTWQQILNYVYMSVDTCFCDSFSGCVSSEHPTSKKAAQRTFLSQGKCWVHKIL